MLAHAGGVPEYVSTMLVAAGMVLSWLGLARLRGKGFPILPRWVAIALIAAGPVMLLAAVVVPSLVWPVTS